MMLCWHHLYQFLLICACCYTVCTIQLSHLEGSVIKGTRNALFLVQNGRKRMFPDFNTFAKMGFNMSSILKVSNSDLESLPMGPALPAIAVFRPDDYMYHTQCEEPRTMVNDLGLVPNLGDLTRFARIYDRVNKSAKMEILLLGGSITAGGYFIEFIQQLQDDSKLNVTYHNHGHGATELQYSIYCVDIDNYRPDLVLIDFSVNDYGHPKLMEALIRKSLALPSKPLVVIVNLWVNPTCTTTRYLIHSYYYGLPIINVCPAVNLCFGRKHLPKYIYMQYSKSDGIHPWGEKGVKFIGEILYAWWLRSIEIFTKDQFLNTDGKMTSHIHHFDILAKEELTAQLETKSSVIGLPAPLYKENPLGICTRCDTLADDSFGRLTPIEPAKGFKIVTRQKVGYGGFKPHDQNEFQNITNYATHKHYHREVVKSSKRSWEANQPGDEIKFRFYGTSVRIAMWQRRDGMGVLYALVDNDEKHITKASGFFKGYTWAMERNNTGRSEILPLFEGLPDGFHVLTLRVSDEPANPWVPGHLIHVFAIMSASDDVHCKEKVYEV